MDSTIVLYNESLACLPSRGQLKGDDRRAFALNAQTAALGYADAVLAMGWFYENGRGIQPNRDLAVRWYRRSARLGEPKARFNLGGISYRDKAFISARRWFQQASEAGHVRSLYWLGKLAWRGQGTVLNRNVARAFFLQASRSHNPEASRLLRYLDRHVCGRKRSSEG